MSKVHIQSFASSNLPGAVGRRLPSPPLVDAYNDGDSFKTAIRDWAALYEVAYAQVYPASDVAKPPPDPGPEPKAPAAPQEPVQDTEETRDNYGKRLSAWAKETATWHFKTYLPWEVERTCWYVAYNTKRDWEALRRLEARQRADVHHRLKVALLRFAVTGLVAGGIVLLGLKLWT